MPKLIYLSAPYTSSDPLVRAERVACCRQAVSDMMLEGVLVLCPITMNHDAIGMLSDRGLDAGGDYWRALEARLAAACDELLVLMLPGWEQSRGVGREISLFKSAGKKVTLVDPWIGVVSAVREKSRTTHSSNGGLS